MVKAGQAVDDFINKLIPILNKGDVIIDGGNSEHQDTTRRCKELEKKGLLYVGSGVSNRTFNNDFHVFGENLCDH